MRILSLALVVSFGLLGCTGSQGDACQVAGDCSDGLVCCKSSPMPDPAVRGTCQATCTYTMRPDAGTDSGMIDVDADTTLDMSVDAATESDAMPGDAETSDAEVTDDASIETDSGADPEDASVAEDAGESETDAGPG